MAPTQLTDDDIRSEWLATSPTATGGDDDDATDTGDATDADDDATDSDGDAADADDDATDS